jgi:hypothetical protein
LNKTRTREQRRRDRHTEHQSINYIYHYLSLSNLTAAVRLGTMRAHVGVRFTSVIVMMGEMIVLIYDCCVVSLLPS